MQFNGIKMGFWDDGPVPGQFYSFPGNKQHVVGPAKRTLHPTVTGTSVVGVKFIGGVMIASDMLGSYGSLARYKNLSRLMKVNDGAILGVSGDYADYQYLQQVIQEMVTDGELLDDGHSLSPKAVHSWLTRVMYQRRCRMNPLWNTVVIGGFQNGESFLGYVDKLGVAYEAPLVATGFGAYLATPLMRKTVEDKEALTKEEARKLAVENKEVLTKEEARELAVENKEVLTKEEARELLVRCLKVLYYRDSRSCKCYEIAIVTEEGVEIVGPLSSETNWDIALAVTGY